MAYAVYGGVCLISPDPIGPHNEREQVWGAFRRFADNHGWVTSVMGASEEWLPVYRDSGMHNIYLGDEAVVRVQSFSLSGGNMKGLRQAHNRIKKYGYTVTFHDPSRLDPALSTELTALMGLSRQGEHERGFSMMLGRVFDPRDTGPAPRRGARSGREGRGHVPVRPGHGHPRLLAGPHAPGPGRPSQRAVRLRPRVDHRASAGRRLRGAQPQLRHPALDPLR